MMVAEPNQESQASLDTINESAISDSIANESVVDKLPSARHLFFKSKGKVENASMITFRSRKDVGIGGEEVQSSIDDNDLSLKSQSTDTITNGDDAYLEMYREDKKNNKKNHGGSQKSLWDRSVDYLKGGMSSVYSHVETCCIGKGAL